ncbi:TolC family protein [Polyangium jinanense]|uniref:TolC family protein n=1 Tax=Polyangium jinanense TaxID=2829994 RepID=A0A9X4ASL1_9BACT|nr:TolC family protein [Polyangium jinanense]MDC3958362.1 TolC family protein [Polyangium jinanense]MDC3983303.1 TolC family protein [Polyangium jinanense]
MLHEDRAVRRWMALLSLGLLLVPGFSSAEQAAATAQSPGLKAFSLREAITYAEKRNPDLVAARARVQAAQAAARVPRAQWLPSVGATAQILGSTVNNSTATVLSNPRVDLPRIGATRISAEPDFTPYASTLVAVGLRQEIFDFGRIAAQTAALDAQAELERQRTEGAKLDVTLEVTEAYWAVRAAKSVAQAADEAAARASTHRDAARAGVFAGLRTPVDLARAEAEVARFEVAKVRAQGSLAAAQAVFAAVVGVPDAALDAGGEAGEDEALGSLDALLERAREGSAEVQQAHARVDLAKAETRAAAAQMRPDIFLTAAISGRAGGAPPSNGSTVGGHGFAPLVPNWDVGVVLSVPLYDPVLAARRDALREVEDVREAELEATRTTQAATVRQAYLGLVAARQALGALERSAAAARANHEQAEARFKAGLGTMLELVDAEALRVEAEVERAVGGFEVARARAALQRAVAEVR